VNVLDAILQSQLSHLGLPSDRNNAGNHVNEVATELVKLSTRQSAALQWLAAGEMDNSKGKDPDKVKNGSEEAQISNRGIWDHVSLQSLQTMYSKLDLLFKQYDEIRTQVTLLRTTCLNYISKKQDDWENWNADEVVDWISAVENGRFLKYDKQLRQVMTENPFKGKDMKTLGFERLTAMGIQDYDDADTLMNCVEILVKAEHNQ